MPIITPKGYPNKLETIGEHIRKKRIDSGLLQDDAAKTIGVNKQTIGYWERGIFNPEIMHIPKIIEFLGYIPFECKSNAPIERLKHFKMINGMSYRRLGKLMGIDETQLGEWVKRIHKPKEDSISRIESFLMNDRCVSR